MAGQLAAAGPPAHGSQVRRPLHPRHHHREPLQAGYEYGWAAWGIVIAGLDALEAGRPCWNGPGTTPPGHAFRLLQHALVPDGQRSSSRSCNWIRFWSARCQRNLSRRLWDHRGERNKLLSRLVPAGARSGEMMWGAQPRSRATPSGCGAGGPWRPAPGRRYVPVADLSAHPATAPTGREIFPINPLPAGLVSAPPFLQHMKTPLGGLEFGHSHSTRRGLLISAVFQTSFLGS